MQYSAAMERLLKQSTGKMSSKNFILLPHPPCPPPSIEQYLALGYRIEFTQSMVPM